VIRRLAPIAFLLALLVMVAGCGGQGDDEGGPEDVAAHGALTGSFALLRPTGATPPRSVEVGLAAAFGPHRHPEVASTYRLDTPLGRAWMLAVEAPGAREETCMVIERSGLTSCAPDTAAKRIGLAVGLSAAAGPPPSKARRFTVMGVVPDRIRSVVVAPLDGRREVLRVSANAFSDRGPSPILIEKYCRGIGTACERPGGR
jgi:hypothetical protein